jgi:hypothetical protein
MREAIPLKRERPAGRWSERPDAHSQIPTYKWRRCFGLSGHRANMFDAPDLKTVFDAWRGWQFDLNISFSCGQPRLHIPDEAFLAIVSQKAALG